MTHSLQVSAVNTATRASVSSPSSITIRSQARPSLLPALYVGSAALQAFDTYSTLTALKSGAIESNPLMRTMVGNPAALITAKAGITAVSIYTAERLWRGHHRIGAITLMAVSNGLMAIIAAHNVAVIRSLR